MSSFLKNVTWCTVCIYVCGTFVASTPHSFADTITVHSSQSIKNTSTSLGDKERLDNLTKKTPSDSAFHLPNNDFRTTNLDMDETTNMRESYFVKGNFSGTANSKKVIRNIDFSRCTLEGADFSYTLIEHCKFENANINNASFEGAVIQFTSFTGAHLQNTCFDGSDHQSVNFDKSDVRCSSWKKSNVWRVSFSFADERGMIKDNMDQKDCSHDKAQVTGFFETYKCPCS